MTNNSKKVCNIASENSVADETLQIVEDELPDGFSLRCDGPHPGLYHTSVSKKEVCKGFSFKHACHVLANTGLLKKGDSRSFTKRPDCALPDFGWTRCYIIEIDGGEG